MRLLLVSLAMLCLGACGSSMDQTAAPDGPVAGASIHELMAEVIAPQADVIWNSTGTLSDETGVHDLSPKTDEDWDHVRSAAVILAEAQNLLVMPGRTIMPQGEPMAPGGTLTEEQIAQHIVQDNAAFRNNAKAMQGLAQQALVAIDAHDVGQLDQVGAQIDQVCEQCHLQFWYPPAT